MTWRATLWIWRNASSLMGRSARAGISIVVVTTPGSTCSHRAWNLSPNARGHVVGEHQGGKLLNVVDAP